jgi:hypothetical protein
MDIQAYAEPQPGDALQASCYEIKRLLRSAAHENVYLAHDPRSAH